MNLVVQKQISLNEGFQLGMERGLIIQISKKLKKSKTLEEISEELECNLDEIRELYEIVKRYEPDYSVDEIMEHLNTL